MSFKTLFNFRNFFSISILILLLITNSACTDFRQALGKEKYIPDEYSVMKTPSLIIPPGFGIDADSFKKKESSRKDETLIIENKNAENKDLEELFDNSDVPKNIRSLVDEETLGVSLGERTGIDILLGQTPKTGVVIDDKKESQRLRKNKKQINYYLTRPTPSINTIDNKKINVE